MFLKNSIWPPEAGVVITRAYVGYSVEIAAASVGFLGTTKSTTTLQTLHYTGGLPELPT